MKYKFPNVLDFKKTLLAQVIADWQLRIDSIESEQQALVDAAPDKIEPYSSFSKKENAEQKSRLILSDLKTPLMEIKAFLNKDFPIQGETVNVFSLFDLTVTEPGGIGKVTTFFVLPLTRLPKQSHQARVDNFTIALTGRDHPFFGKKLRDRIKIAGGEIWEEPHMGHIVKTGRIAKGGVFQVTGIYQ